MVEGMKAETEGQIDLKEVYMLLDDESGFLYLARVHMRPWTASRPPIQSLKYGSFFNLQGCPTQAVLAALS